MGDAHCYDRRNCQAGLQEGAASKLSHRIYGINFFAFHLNPYRLSGYHRRQGQRFLKQRLIERVTRQLFSPKED